MWTSTAPRTSRMRFEQLEGDFVIGLVVLGRAGDLHVDGRGEAEVEDLADDVGGLGEEFVVGHLLLERGGVSFT